MIKHSPYYKFTIEQAMDFLLQSLPSDQYISKTEVKHRYANKVNCSWNNDARFWCTNGHISSMLQVLIDRGLIDIKYKITNYSLRIMYRRKMHDI